MTLFFPTLVAQTTTTEGTGDIDLDGSSPGYLDFDEALNDGDTCIVIVRQGDVFEKFFARFNTGGSLTRITSYKNSNNINASIDWGSGKKDVYATWHDEMFLRRNGGASTSYIIDNDLDFVDARDNPTVTFTLNHDGAFFRVKVDGANYATINPANEDWYFNKKIGGVEAGFDVLKQSGNVINNAAYRVVGAANGNLAELNSDGKFDRALIYTMGGASAGSNGSSGLVPQPIAGQENSFLKGDGTFGSAATRFVGAWLTSLGNGLGESQNHGFGAYPDQYWIEMECLVSDAGFSPGQRTTFMNNVNSDDGKQTGLTIRTSATTIAWFYGRDGLDVIRLAGTDTVETLNLSRWRARAMGVIYG